MELKVVRVDGGHRLDGDGPFTDVANRYLAHLATRGFAPETVRGYAFDLLNFGRFLAERQASLADVVPTDLFDYLDWQAKPKCVPGAWVVRLAERRGAAPATMNPRIAAVRGLGLTRFAGHPDYAA
jgi:integrase/recombinase XerC